MTRPTAAGTEARRVVVVSVTERGAGLARRLPWDHRRGSLAETVRAVWTDVDGLVLVCATGIAVRTIAPLLAGKHADPAIVCVDDAGRWAVALTGGHRGANDLARDVAGLLDAEAVITTASDGAGLPALDALPGFRARGDVAGVMRAWLDGTPPAVDATDLPDWPLPTTLASPDEPRSTTPASRDEPRSGRGNSAPPDLPEAMGHRHGAPLPQERSAVPYCLDPDSSRDQAKALGPVPRVLETDRAPEQTDAGVPADEPDAAGPTPRVVVTDRVVDPSGGEVVLVPASLVVGVGASSGADAGGIAALVADALHHAGLDPAAVGLVATVDLKRDEPGIVALAHDLAVELRTFPVTTLAGVDVPNPSTVVAAAVGTPSVAEAAALVAAGPGGRLVVTKRRSSEATVAVARRARPEGHLAVVGLGPGDAAHRTPAATTAIRHADVVVGYGPYVDQVTDLLGPHHEVVRSPIGAEADRCHDALARAAHGQTVALVCSGDPGVFAMASLVCELAPGHGDPPVTVVPGITAAAAAAAVLGAPLGHDHAAVSLSDLLTPWPLIERRLHAVARADMAVSLYNPRSQRRTWQLDRAIEILAGHRPPDCPVAVVTDVGRPGEHVVHTTLGAFDPTRVGMLSLVVVGSSTTRRLGHHLVTPRGYTQRPPNRAGQRPIISASDQSADDQRPTRSTSDRDASVSDVENQSPRTAGPRSGGPPQLDADSVHDSEVRAPSAGRHDDGPQPGASISVHGTGASGP
jgi:cobalt-precorrin 5A hydrolase / cobalt-factor III methyltransferase / precorrin-3B C17-methyltransferase